MNFLKILTMIEKESSFGMNIQKRIIWQNMFKQVTLGIKKQRKQQEKNTRDNRRVVCL